MEYVISIDLGATNLRVGLVSEDLKIIEVNRERTTKNDKNALLKQICRLIETLPYEEYNVRKVGEYLPFFIIGYSDREDAQKFVDFKKGFYEDWEVCTYDDKLQKWVEA